jgi:hypothetical protein
MHDQATHGHGAGRPRTVAQILADEEKVRARRLDLDHQLVTLQRERRQTGRLAEAAVARQSESLLADAGDRLGASAAAVAAAKAHLEDLGTRAEAGDETIKGFDLAVAKEDVTLAETRHRKATSDHAKAARTHNIDACDNHIADFVADALDCVLDVPVFVHRRPENAPDIEPRIVLSQTEPTKGYGTLDVSGAVAVTVVGDPAVDWQAVRDFFAETGSEVTVSPGQITVADACFPVPVLREPSASPLDSLARDIGEQWKLVTETTATMIEDHTGKYLTTGDGYYQTGKCDLVSFDHGEGAVGPNGTAAGRMKLIVGTNLRIDTDYVTARIKGAVEEVLAHGIYTAMGQIVDHAVTSVKECDHVWDRRRTYLRESDVPLAWVVEIEVSAVYEPALEAVAA